MKLDQLKQGFFGDQKADVCRYVTSPEENYSRQLAEPKNAAAVQVAEYQAQIQHLEYALHESKQRYENQLQAQLRISSTLQKAEHYAEVLHKEVEAEALHKQAVWQQLDA